MRIAPVTALAVQLALFSGASAQETEKQPQSPSLWEYRSNKDILFITSVPRESGLVLVGTKAGLVCLNSESGAVVWDRRNVKRVSSIFVLRQDPDAAAVPIVERLRVMGIYKKRFEMLSMTDGLQTWHGDSLPLKEVRGYRVLSKQGVLLAYGKTRESDHSLMAVDVATGVVAWRNDSLFRRKPELAKGFDNPLKLVGHHDPVVDTDTTAVLYMDKDGPLKVHIGTGQVLWRATGFEGRKVPLRREGYAPILVAGEVLIVPYDDKRLAGIRAGDGEVMWTVQLKDRPRKMARTPHGIVVQGIPRGAFLDVLDPATGTSNWPARFEDLKDATRFRLKGDKAFIAARGALMEFDLRSGEHRQLATVEFEGGERPDFIHVYDEGLVLISLHNVAMFDYDGAQLYNRYYKKPGRGIGGLFKMAAADRIPQQPTGIGPGHVYIFTETPDAAGRVGYSIVKLNKLTGEEEGRIWLKDKIPDYKIDSNTGTVYLRKGKKEIVAFRF